MKQHPSTTRERVGSLCSGQDVSRVATPLYDQIATSEFLQSPGLHSDQFQAPILPEHHTIPAPSRNCLPLVAMSLKAAGTSGPECLKEFLSCVVNGRKRERWIRFSRPQFSMSRQPSNGSEANNDRMCMISHPVPPASHKTSTSNQGIVERRYSV
jgi:hypothetical protein